MTGPDFIVIGAMKCASSTVNAYLEDHPETFMVPGREPRYFSHDEHYARGPEWYAELFRSRGTAKLAGEGSNDYSSGARFPEAAARMAAYNPDMKIIYMVRHPIQRIFSAWVQNRVDRGDKVPSTVDRAVIERPEVYVDQSLYWRNLNLYRAHFPDSQIFLGFMEDLRADPAAFFSGLTGFLGLEEMAAIKRGHQNPSDTKRVPTGAYSSIRGSGIFPILKAVLPKSIRSSIKSRYLSADYRALPRLSDEVRARIAPQISDDAAQFLAHAGKPADFWDLVA